MFHLTFPLLRKRNKNTILQAPSMQACGLRSTGRYQAMHCSVLWLCMYKYCSKYSKEGNMQLFL